MMKQNFMEKLLDGVEVEWRKLGEVANLITTGKLNANEMEEEGLFPFYTCNENPYRINSYAFDLEAIIISGNGSQVGHLNYFKGKFNAYQRTYIVANFIECIQIMYIYHYLNHTLKSYIIKNSRKGSVPYITMPMLENFEIPIPCPQNPEKSLKIQAEIVRILDTFIELIAELAAELTARKKQYNYYRDKLLSFEDEEVEWRVLGEVTLPTSNIRWRDTNDTYRYIDLTSVCRDKNIIIETTEISAENAPSRAQKLVAKDDVIFATTRPTQQRLCLITEEYSGEVASTGYCILRAKEEVLPKWIYYFITSTRFKEYVEDNQSGSAYPAISDAKVKEFNIPVPSLNEQESIVSILDKFEVLTTSIVDGLPREIELRQKQYEHYRKMLLSFPREGVAE